MDQTLLSYLVIPFFVLVFYFLILKPQQKQKRLQSDMNNNIEVGDEIETHTGILGTIVKIKENTFHIKSASSTIEIKRDLIKVILKKNKLEKVRKGKK